MVRLFMVLLMPSREGLFRRVVNARESDMIVCGGIVCLVEYAGLQDMRAVGDGSLAPMRRHELSQSRDVSPTATVTALMG